MSAGSKLRKAIEEEVPLQVVGTINAYCARLAERAGFKALYLSGAGAANASFGLPDLGITTLNDVCEDARRITATTEPSGACRFQEALKGIAITTQCAQGSPRTHSEGCTSDGRLAHGHFNAWRAGVRARFHGAGCDRRTATFKH
jgi:isocitrate lyase